MFCGFTGMSYEFSIFTEEQFPCALLGLVVNICANNFLRENHFAKSFMCKL